MNDFHMARSVTPLAPPIPRRPTFLHNRHRGDRFHSIRRKNTARFLKCTCNSASRIISMRDSTMPRSSTKKRAGCAGTHKCFCRRTPETRDRKRFQGLSKQNPWLGVFLLVELFLINLDFLWLGNAREGIIMLGVHSDYLLFNGPANPLRAFATALCWTWFSCDMEMNSPKTFGRSAWSEARLATQVCKCAGIG